MKALALCSGGLDSSVSMAIAISKGINVKRVLFCDYGQKSVEKELSSVKQISRHYKVKLNVVTLPFLKQISNTSLVNRKKGVPRADEKKIKDLKYARKLARQVWIPNRNGLFLNISACYCDSLGLDGIITGFDREEAATFPDNSSKFVQLINSALSLSTAVKPKVKSYVLNLDKKTIVKKAIELDVPLNMVWSCYLGGIRPCGRCESCIRSKLAFRANGISR